MGFFPFHSPAGSSHHLPPPPSISWPSWLRFPGWFPIPVFCALNGDFASGASGPAGCGRLGAGLKTGKDTFRFSCLAFLPSLFLRVPPNDGGLWSPLLAFPAQTLPWEAVSLYLLTRLAPPGSLFSRGYSAPRGNRTWHFDPKFAQAPFSTLESLQFFSPPPHPSPHLLLPILLESFRRLSLSHYSCTIKLEGASVL
ncbi:hypothetical protein E2320_015704 [Naja naja]|nr:hypothetical protein E2320_015704 [Naja naja]